MKLSAAIAAKTNQWDIEAELNFARRGREGIKMHRAVWANGRTMVGHEGALPNQMVPLEQAIEIFRAGWKLFAN